MISYFNTVTFKHPEFFWLLLLIPFLIYFYFRFKVPRQPRIRISSTEAFEKYRPTLRQRVVHLPFILRMVILALIIVALARPRSSSRASDVRTEGISIILALDISKSMLAEDFRPNRIEAAKKVALNFIQGRPNDLIGMVIFAGEGFTQCPITSDHSVLVNLIANIKPGMLTDGTAIGEGLATAVARIKDAQTKSKVIVLITDGVNNSGSIPPITAGEIAKTFGVRVYTIGVGTKGMAPYPVPTPFGIQYQNMEVQIDEELMSSIAESTDGKYFRATDNRKLKTIFEEIDRMEKTKIEVTEFKRYTEEYFPWLFSALIFFALEILIRYSWLRSLP